MKMAQLFLSLSLVLLGLSLVEGGILGTPDEQLSFLLEQLQQSAVGANVSAVLPSTVAALQGKADDTTADPLIRAASWLVTKDTVKESKNTMRRFALAAIYYATNGPSWKNSTNYLSSASHCDWHGITCCSELRVAPSCALAGADEIAEVDFHKNNLVGKVSPAFSLLFDARTMFLSGNSLSGPLPNDELGTLPNLMMLYLQHNQLTGTVSTTLLKAAYLDTIYVQGNKLNGSWPTDEFCVNQAGNKIQYLGLDCDKITCPQTCCSIEKHCFYGNP